MVLLFVLLRERQLVLDWVFTVSPINDRDYVVVAGTLHHDDVVVEDYTRAVI